MRARVSGLGFNAFASKPAPSATPVWSAFAVYNPASAPAPASAPSPALVSAAPVATPQAQETFQSTIATPTQGASPQVLAVQTTPTVYAQIAATPTRGAESLSQADAGAPAIEAPPDQSSLATGSGWGLSSWLTDVPAERLWWILAAVIGGYYLLKDQKT